MSEFLLELFSEEIPARMQKRAMEDLVRLLDEGFKKAGILQCEFESFVAPRRLGVGVTDLPTATPEVREEKKGPKLGASQAAIDGFIRAAGIASISEARIESDAKKGDYYVVDVVKAGAKTTEIIAELVPQIIRNFPWPKSMRWGEGSLRWVRPLHRVLALFDGEIVPFEIEGIKASNQTEGHRFHGNGVFAVANFADYKTKIAAANVIIDREVRKASILVQAGEICAKNGLELVDDIGLLEEVCGLVDKPFVILGQMDAAFLDLPPEVIRLTLRLNQKYFVANDKATGKLAPYFIVVSNVNASDGGKAIALGNARVLSARLNDARYFWDLDRKTPLASRVAKLDTLVFHEKLGSVGEKVKRIVELAGEIAPLVGANVDDAKRAALLCKADLTTEMVGEFPELQGIMGRYYASLGAVPSRPPIYRGAVERMPPPLQVGEELASVANAIAEHYKPIGPSDNVPTHPVSIAVALADKFDTLVGFFAIGEKPTGSGDPYALRRAALGIIRIILENELHLNYYDLVEYLTVEALTNLALKAVDEAGTISNIAIERGYSEETIHEIVGAETHTHQWAGRRVFEEGIARVKKGLPSFFLDRLKIYLRDQGFEHDIIDAAYAIDDDDLVRIVNRIKALSIFLKTTEGENLLAGYKRAANILKAEEKKGWESADAVVNPSLFKENAEMSLFATLGEISSDLAVFLAKEDFAGALGALSSLRSPIYAFLDDVLVNDADASIRQNRLALLAQLRQMMAKIADFECIRGN
ncbi:MAG: glycyl-tRNA synthetase beta chain [Hyphomonadaceae bacterium]|nr:MAG: glycyl-tRNA synthetase beta chain [Hyphomonadaceae bacterium]